MLIYIDEARDCSCQQDSHWTEFLSATEPQMTPETVSGSERKRREAVWELFTSQCVFLFDHLMVLKHVRAETRWENTVCNNNNGNSGNNRRAAEHVMLLVFSSRSIT